MIIDKNTGDPKGYSQEERNEALNVSLTAVASAMGYTPVKRGVHYILKEMDSLVIYNDRSWYRWSGKGNITGGTQIDFMLEFGGIKSVAEAIGKLIGFNIDNAYMAQNIEYEDNDKREFVLPPKNKDYRRTYAYLIKTRGLSSEVVSDFIRRKLIYEDAVHHNLVFLGYNPDGIVKYAGLRGTYDINGNKFQSDVPGNDKNYGVNIVNKENDTLFVFEAVIDCMSYIDITHDNISNKLVLSMVEDNPLQQFLEDYDHIKKIRFCLDHDEAGHKALYGKYDSNCNLIKEGLIKKYESKGFDIEVLIPPSGKDWNEALLNMRKEGSLKQIHQQRKGR